MLIVACSTSKKATEQATDTTVTTEIKTLVVVKPTTITGNATVSVQLGEKSVKLNGALKMWRDKVVRVQLYMPLLGTEIGRMDFTPDYLLVVDRINKQYAKVSYSEIDALEQNGISFEVLQSLFWNEATDTSFVADGVVLTWDYSNYAEVENISFPKTQEITLTSPEQNGYLKIDMKELKTATDWDTATSLSTKYTQISARAIVNMLKSL